MMFAPREILCLLDLSAVSAAVCSWASLFAQAFGAKVEIFHVAQPGDDELEIKGRLEGLAHDAATAHRVVIAEGHPVKVVYERMESRPPEVIVMGTHGYDGMARVLMGSVAENVVRIANCPMLVVRGAELQPGQKELKSILCPVNPGEADRQVLDLAVGVTAKLKACLTVAQVLPQTMTEMKGAGERLRAWLPEAALSLTPTSTAILQGDPAEQIVSYARDHAIELIVLGAERRPFLEYITLGRTTERVMRFSPCTVLLVPR
jgi:nucleotide-binding universal stress UspA family protein